MCGITAKLWRLWQSVVRSTGECALLVVVCLCLVSCVLCRHLLWQQQAARGSQPTTHAAARPNKGGRSTAGAQHTACLGLPGGERALVAVAVCALGALTSCLALAAAARLSLLSSSWLPCLQASAPLTGESRSINAPTDRYGGDMLSIRSASRLQARVSCRSVNRNRLWRAGTRHTDLSLSWPHAVQLPTGTRSFHCAVHCTLTHSRSPSSCHPRGEEHSIAAAAAD